MKRLSILVLLLVAGWWAWPESDFLLGGIQVNEADHDAWMEALEDGGFNTVSVTIYAHQGDWDTDNLWWDQTNDGVLAEVRAARRAGVKVVLILRVALDHAFPRNRFLWHGMIMPKDDALLAAWFDRYEAFVRHWAAFAEAEGVDLLGISSELNALTSTVEIDELPPLEEYFINQETQEVEKAKLVEHAAEVDLSQLEVRGHDNFEEYESYLDARIMTHGAWARQVTWSGKSDSIARINRRRHNLDARWRRIIAAAGDTFQGPLTYAANFDQYRDITFWDDLDMIGINAYFELRDRWQPLPDVEPLYPELRGGWARVLAEIDAFRTTDGLVDKPVLFSELGYSRRRNCTLRPWSATGFAVMPKLDGGEKMVVWGKEPEALGERALAVRALYDELRELSSPMLAGILWWKLSTEPAHVGEEPYVMILDDDPADPLAPELRAFTGWPPWQLAWRALRDWVS